MRVKGGSTTRKYRKSVLKKAKGTRGTRHNSYRIAKQTIIRSAQYAFRDRKTKKRNFRKLWIVRINAAIHELGYNYSTFANNLKKKNIKINRKMLSELAISQPEEFKSLVEKVCAKK